MAAQDPPNHPANHPSNRSPAGAGGSPAIPTSANHGAGETPAADNVWLTAESVRVLAHPLRSRLLGALRRGGPATATDLAAELGTNSGATSYHLRKLESVGLVRDTGEGEGKRRLWRAASEYTAWNPSDFAGDEDAETALNWLTRDYARHFGEQYDKWLDVSTTWPTAWQDVCGSNDGAVLVTAEALGQMQDEMWELIQKYRRVGQGNPLARRIAVYAFAFPIDLDRPPTGGSAR